MRDPLSNGVTRVMARLDNPSLSPGVAMHYCLAKREKRDVKWSEKVATVMFFCPLPFVLSYVILLVTQKLKP